MPQSFLVRSKSITSDYGAIRSHECDDEKSNLEPDDATFSLLTSTQKQKILLLGLCLSDMFSSMCLSIMGPFFPQEAEKRNISVTLSGWIFGVFALTRIFMSPLCGKMMPILGSRFMYLAGLFLSGGCTILFGFLEYIPIVKNGENADFIILCFILRIFMAIGCSSQECASFTIISLEFQNDISTVIGICEVFVGVGLAAGPALGGALYGAGGFILPFAVTGSVFWAIIPINFWILSKRNDQTFDRLNNIMVLFKNPLVLVTCFVIMISSTVWAGLDPILEPHLRIFSLSSPIVGLLFLLMSVTYAISSPFWGCLSDNMSDTKNLLIPGFYLMAVSLLFLGPSPVLKIQEDYLWLNIVCLAVLGISVSLSVVPTYDMLLEHAENAGFVTSIGTHGIVAGIWTSMYACGEFVGPTLSGYLVDVVGFQLSLTYIAIGCFSAGTLLLFLKVLSCFSRCFSKLH